MTEFKHKENIRIGVYVCWCGNNIASLIDVEDVAKQMQTEAGVVISKTYKYMCSDPGQELIIKDIKENELNRVVVAACSPRIHEPTFRKALEIAGLNPYMLQMANIREQVSWVHKDRKKATNKAASLVAAAIKRVIHHKPLPKRKVDINAATLIIGGGVSGMSAALTLGDAGKQVYLVEKTKQLGGLALKTDVCFPTFNCNQEFVSDMVKRVEAHAEIRVFKEAAFVDNSGYIGNFKATINNGQSYEIDYGNLILATGLKAFSPASIPSYAYQELPDVITSLELEERLKEGKLSLSNGQEPKHISIIHCVGSRNDNHHAYCSRTCCMTGLKYANQLKAALPNAHIYELYADMRTMDKNGEELYAKTARKGVMFLMFDQRNGLPKITQGEKALKINFREQISGEEIEVKSDLVILLTAVEAHEDAKQVAKLAGVSMNRNKFFIEKHPKLDPVATTTNGVYLAGNCQSPKNITESIAQANAAAARILGVIAKGSVEVEAITAHVDEEICCGCQFCVMTCPYSAVSYLPELKVSNVNEVLCKGCGTCGSTCPSGAIRSKHFTDVQILSQIEGLMDKVFEIRSNQLKEV